MEEVEALTLRELRERTTEPESRDQKRKNGEPERQRVLSRHTGESEIEGDDSLRNKKSNSCKLYPILNDVVLG